MAKTKRKVSDENEEKNMTKKIKKGEKKEKKKEDEKKEKGEEEEIESEEEEKEVEKEVEEVEEEDGDTEIINGLKELLYTLKHSDLKPYALLYKDPNNTQGTLLVYATRSDEVPIQASRFCSISPDLNLCSAIIEKKFIVTNPSLLAASFYEVTLTYKVAVRDDFSSHGYYKFDMHQSGLIVFPLDWDQDDIQDAYFRGIEHEVGCLLESKGKQLLSITEKSFTIGRNP